MNLEESIKKLRGNGYQVSKINDKFVVYHLTTKSFELNCLDNSSFYTKRQLIKYCQSKFSRIGKEVKKYKGFRGHEKIALKKHEWDKLPTKNYLIKDNRRNWD